MAGYAKVSTSERLSSTGPDGFQEENKGWPAMLGEVHLPSHEAANRGSIFA
jgi:hypothetical protein